MLLAVQWLDILKARKGQRQKSQAELQAALESRCCSLHLWFLSSPLPTRFPLFPEAAPILKERNIWCLHSHACLGLSNRDLPAALCSIPTLLLLYPESHGHPCKCFLNPFVHRILARVSQRQAPWDVEGAVGWGEARGFPSLSLSSRRHLQP